MQLIKKKFTIFMYFVIETHKNPWYTIKRERKRIMKLFLSTFVHKVDKKGRVSLPSSFRQVLQQGDTEEFAVVRSFQKPALEGMMMSRMEQLTHVIDGIGVYSQEQQDLAAVLLADSKLMTLDSEGRIILSEELIVHAGIVEKAMFVGKGRIFEIWSPEIYDGVLQQARNRLSQSNVSLSLGRLTSNTQGDL
jgi:MraZ protein